MKEQMSQSVSRENPEGLTAREMLDRFRNDGSCEKALLALLDECKSLRGKLDSIEASLRRIAEASGGDYLYLGFAEEVCIANGRGHPVAQEKTLLKAIDAAISENAANALEESK